MEKQEAVSISLTIPSSLPLKDANNEMPDAAETKVTKQ